LKSYERLNDEKYFKGARSEKPPIENDVQDLQDPKQVGNISRQAYISALKFVWFVAESDSSKCLTS